MQNPLKHAIMNKCAGMISGYAKSKRRKPLPITRIPHQRLKLKGVFMEISEQHLSTKPNKETFEISISGEGDVSPDGGYSFEETTHTAELTMADARTLYCELLEFLGFTK